MQRLAALSLAIVLTLGAPAATACLDRIVVLSKARFHLGEQRSAVDGEIVSLPDSWRRSRPAAGGFGWYRFTLDLERAGQEPCALNLPAVDLNAVAYVNGTWVGQGGSFEPPVAHNFNRPLLFEFPASLLRVGRNEIDVGLYAVPHGAGAIAPIRIGPRDQLVPIHARDYRTRIGLAQASTAVAVLTLVLAGVLWIATRFEALYGWFMAATAAWAVNGLNYWVRDIPFEHWTWERLMNGALDQIPILLTLWARERVGFRRPGVRSLLLASGAVALYYAVLPRPWFGSGALVMHACAVALGAFLCIQVLRHREKLSRLELGVYALVGTLAVALSGRDWIGQTAAVPPPPSLPLALALIVPAFGITLLLRFLGALSEAETLNASLEARVLEREQALTANFEQMQRLEQQALLARERDRITREMHDGLGGQLVSALALVEASNESAPEVADVLRGALTEMRIVIDSLDPRLGDVTAVLAQLRSRLGAGLERAGVRLEWAVSDLPATDDWSPERLLHVMRVVQEAITNAIRHSGATRIAISTAVRPDASGRDGFEIQVCDDGCGISAEASPGRGVQHMRSRAGEIGGTLEISSAEPGTCVTLWVPSVVHP